jgi:hypothetical protein
LIAVVIPAVIAFVVVIFARKVEKSNIEEKPKFLSEASKQGT